MSRAAFAIPEKIYFKIGEVCDLVGVQAHVLRYWETEFPTLAPQKNRAGQRTYRRRDVEMALRIKELLYEELYTIAGAKKKLSTEIRGDQPKLKIVTADSPKIETPREFETAKSEPVITQVQTFAAKQTAPDAGEIHLEEDFQTDFHGLDLDDQRRSALQNLAQQLAEIRQLLNAQEETPRNRW
jgi:DNA-binding transcriptional MerR regulator